jgi:hypothetical protein
MGNTDCKPIKPQMGGARNLYKLMNTQPQYTEQNTINFNRKDLADTLSDRSILDIIHQGGSTQINNIPKRDRFSQLESQKIRNKNSNLIGGHQYSSVSESELSALKNLILMNGGNSCGCGENKVLKGGVLDSATSTFVPNNNDLSQTSIDNLTSSGRNLQATQLSINKLPNSVLDSATSTFVPNNNDLSQTSIDNFTNSKEKLQATSNFSQSDNSAMKRLTNLINIQLGGFDYQVNSTSDLISAFSTSTTSKQPIEYSTLMGGAWGKKKQKGGENSDRIEDDIDESSSSTTESTTTTTKTEENKQSRIEKLRNKEKVRSSSASSTSSSGSTISSTITGSTDSTTNTSSESSIYSTVSGRLGRNNVYLTSATMSDGNYIDAKQFYSSEHGDLYSSDTNYLRHNLNKRRFR